MKSEGKKEASLGTASRRGQFAEASGRENEDAAKHANLFWLHLFFLFLCFLGIM